jgi:pyruvate/2-oxoglutarate/acetoin dehydrogenase E1 component
LLGIPNLIVLAASNIISPIILYKNAYSTQQPVVIIENKILYNQKMLPLKDNKIDIFSLYVTNSLFPTIKLSSIESKSKSPHYTIICYGNMLTLAMKVCKTMLIEDEILMNIILVTQLNPTPIKDILSFIEFSGTLITIEEGTKGGNWGTSLIGEINSELTKQNILLKESICLTSEDSIIPIARNLEKDTLINLEKIIKTIKLQEA